MIRSFLRWQQSMDYDKSSNEVQVSKVDPSGNSLLRKIFTNFFDKDFRYKLNEIKTPELNCTGD